MILWPETAFTGPLKGRIAAGLSQISGNQTDHRLNMTLDADIEFTSLSAFYLLNHCVDENEFCLISRVKRFQARTI